MKLSDLILAVLICSLAAITTIYNGNYGYILALYFASSTPRASVAPELFKLYQCRKFGSGSG